MKSLTVSSSGNQGKRIHSSSYFPRSPLQLLCLLCLFLSVFWIFALITLVFDWRPFNESASHRSFHLFSYTRTLEEYRSTIPGLLYKVDEVFDGKTTRGIPKPPQYFRLGDLLSDWEPDDTAQNKWAASRAHPDNKKNAGGGITRFDYSDDEQRAIALKFRDAEVPFVLYNVPEVKLAGEQVFTLKNLLKVFGSTPRIVERSANNHFMYYSMRNQLEMLASYPTWSPPQMEMPMTFSRFLRECEEAEKPTTGTGSEEFTAATNRSLHYMTMSAGEGAKTPWVRSALPMFTKQESFFIVDTDGYRGINCRFGMRGVIAASHYDGQRNFVAMVRGRKRYVLLPPSECDNLSLYPRGHPSARHSKIDWSNATERRRHPELESARATEVVLSMGEMLYIPSYWFHYIISQDSSIQCNARSGDSQVGRSEITNCGFYKEGGVQRGSTPSEKKKVYSETDNSNKGIGVKRPAPKKQRGLRFAPPGEQWQFEQ